MKNRKLMVSLIALVLVVACAVGATVAYITDKTEEVTNTFTVGNIDINLAETTDPDDYVIVPGNDIPKNPAVTVVKDSEDAYVFVKIDETNDFSTYMEYTVADGWTKLDVVDATVYYREYTQTAKDTVYYVLKDNKVTVKSEITKTQLDAIGTNYPTLSFTGYAIQKDGFTTAAAAWNELNN